MSASSAPLTSSPSWKGPPAPFPPRKDAAVLPPSPDAPTHTSMRALRSSCPRPRPELRSGGQRKAGAGGAKRRREGRESPAANRPGPTAPCCPALCPRTPDPRGACGAVTSRSAAAGRGGGGTIAKDLPRFGLQTGSWSEFVPQERCPAREVCPSPPLLLGSSLVQETRRFSLNKFIKVKFSLS